MDLDGGFQLVRTSIAGSATNLFPGVVFQYALSINMQLMVIYI